MNKLELKHLAPYLPYGLTIYDKYKKSDKFDIYEMTLNNLNGVIKNDLRKPILRPLSDLKKMIKHNGNTFCPFNVIDEDCNYDHICDTDYNTDWSDKGDSIYDYLELFIKDDSKYRINFLPYGLITKLFEWHFDVFGLIPKGIAIDINTLDNE
tara:strand:- start:1572 stop:2030 length:459 start_codon:yes stop_codon:yes gene_type:complete